MRKKSPVEMEQSRIIRVTRTLIRLKHSLNADEEINNILPETLEQFEKGVQLGQLRGVDTKLLEDII